MRRIALSLFAAIVGCSAQPIQHETDGGTWPTQGTGSDPRIDTIIGTASTCGGFERSTEDDGNDVLTGTSGKSDTADPQAYCDAALIRWSCDAKNPGLKLQLTRQSFQCCADLKVTMAPEDSAYRLEVKDVSEEPCDCMCVFDADVKATDMPCEPIELRVGTKTFTVPLNEKSGTITASAVPLNSCRE